MAERDHGGDDGDRAEGPGERDELVGNHRDQQRQDDDPERVREKLAAKAERVHHDPDHVFEDGEGGFFGEFREFCEFVVDGRFRR